MKKFIVVITVLGSLLLGAKKGSAYLLDSNCGRSDIPNAKIAGGHDTDIFSNPWMVLVLVNGQQKCGGSLITPRFVLTAAHCIFTNQMSVRLGDYAPRHPRNGFIINVDREIPHEEYGRERDGKNDIGLLRMARQVEYTDFIRPICILFRQQLETPLSYNVTGWGRNEHNQWSRTLQGTTVYNTDRSFCINEFTVNVDQSQICAYSYTSDTCGGDSGGPLSAEVSYRGITLPVQFGILNYGSRLCRKVGINVYANVMHYTDWLERTLMRNSDN